jgi:alpha-methylacyl-CoA racemase
MRTEVSQETKTGPLAGLTVIEMAGLGPVPLAGLMLSEMGGRGAAHRTAWINPAVSVAAG